MAEWTRHLQTLRPLASLPLVAGIGRERRRSADYAHRGVDRQGDRHICFQYTLEGEGRFRDASGEHPLRVGAGFLCRVDDPAIAYYYPPDGREAWEFVYIAFRGEFGLRVGEELIARHGHMYELPATAPCIQRLLAFGEEPAQPALDAFTVARLVIDLLAALDQVHQPGAHSPRRQLLQAAMAAVQEHRDRPLTVGDLARRFSVSREHLTRVFSAELGITPHTYIARQRLLEGCDLLRRTNLSIKEIAHRLGYPGSPQFSRAFRQTFGLPPTQYRAQGTFPTF